MRGKKFHCSANEIFCYNIEFRAAFAGCLRYTGLYRVKMPFCVGIQGRKIRSLKGFYHKVAARF